MKSTIAAALAGVLIFSGLAFAKDPKDHKVTKDPKDVVKEQTAPKDPTSVAGFWAQSDDDGRVNGWFYFSKKNGLYEGRLVKMFPKPDAPKMSDFCEKCPGDQKGAAMLGLTIIKGMKRDGLKYDNGSIMDPRDGTIYHAQMEVSPDGQQLSVRGYLGIPLLGQTQVWARLPDDSIPVKDIPKDSAQPNPDEATPAPAATTSE